LAIAVGSCLLVGSAPGLRAATLDLTPGLGGSGQAIGRSRAKVRRALVVLEVGLAMVLLACAALMATRFARMTTIDAGIDAAAVVAVPLAPVVAASVGAGCAGLLQAIERPLLEDPAVHAVGATTTYPCPVFDFSNTVKPGVLAASVPPSGLLPAQWRSVTHG